MISGSRNILWLLPLFLLVTSPLWKPSVVDFLAPRGDFDVESVMPVTARSFVMTEVRMDRWLHGEPDMLLAASRVQSGRWDDNDFFLIDIDVRLFADGAEKAHIAGGEGMYEAVQEILTLVDDVTVEVEDEYVLSTDALRYLVKYKTMKTAAGILFETEGAVVRGGNMRYNLESGAYRVGGGVVCDLNS